MPKRTFIANIDDANAEVVRLDGENAGLVTRAEKAESDLEAANSLMEEATTNLENANAQVLQLQGEVKTLKEKNTTLEKAKVKDTTVIARAKASGAVAENSTTTDDTNAKTPARGLQRAINARQEQLRAQTAGQK